MDWLDVFKNLKNIKINDYEDRVIKVLPEINKNIIDFLHLSDMFLLELKNNNINFIINSGYRTIERQIKIKENELKRQLTEKEKKEVSNSYHCQGLAFDIGLNKNNIIDAFLIAVKFFKRVGLYSWGLHIDAGESFLYWYFNKRYYYYNNYQKAVKVFINASK
ncbi:MAG TPA: M15 family metallopeptidase [archaeon]|nr:M15 family metallopeptidase [archaeon]